MQWVAAYPCANVYGPRLRQRHDKWQFHIQHCKRAIAIRYLIDTVMQCWDSPWCLFTYIQDEHHGRRPLDTERNFWGHYNTCVTIISLASCLQHQWQKWIVGLWFQDTFRGPESMPGMDLYLQRRSATLQTIIIDVTTSKMETSLFHRWAKSVLLSRPWCMWSLITADLKVF